MWGSSKKSESSCQMVRIGPVRPEHPLKIGLLLGYA